MSGNDRKPPDRFRTRHRVELATLGVTVLGVLVALGAWLLPRGDRDRPAPSAPPAGAGTVAGPTSPGSAPPAATARYLTELTPAAGAGEVQRVGARSLVMRCGSGEGDDRHREVTYDLPRTGYREFRTAVRTAGERETRVQVTVLVDRTVAAQPILVAGDTRQLTADVAGAARLSLRITCDPGAGPATFADPGLYR